MFVLCIFVGVNDNRGQQVVTQRLLAQMVCEILRGKTDFLRRKIQPMTASLPDGGDDGQTQALQVSVPNSGTGGNNGNAQDGNTAGGDGNNGNDGNTAGGDGKTAAGTDASAEESSSSDDE